MDLPIASSLSLGAPSSELRRFGRPNAPQGGPRRSGTFERRSGHFDRRDAAFRHHTARPQCQRPLAPVRAGKGVPVVEETLKAGDLVDFVKDKPGRLGLIAAQDGKRNLWVLEAQTHGLRRISIQPRQVQYKLPGGPFTEQHLTDFTAAAQADSTDQKTQCVAGVSPLLGDAWEMAVADQLTSLSLTEIAGLVMPDESPLNLFRCYRMLSHDRLYFKQVLSKDPTVEPRYEPRSAEMVAAARALLAAEAEAREDEAAWSAAVRDALSKRRRSEQPSPEQWESGRHRRRIAALKALATKDAPALPTELFKLAQQSLALAGIIVSSTAQPADGAPGAVSPLAEAATNLLVDLRAWRRHEPVAALRMDALPPLPDSLEQEAQALLASPPPDSCASIRIDLTHLPAYTLDDTDTTEIDDALSVEFLETDLETDKTDSNGLQSSTTSAAAGDTEGVQGPGEPVVGVLGSHVRVWVHVSDPTRWLAPNSALVDAARLRTRTLYFPFGKVPMFPKCLAEGPFSLRCNQDSDALSIGVRLTPQGRVIDVQVVPSRIRVTHQLSYEQADELIAAQAPQDAAVARELRVLRAAADVRRALREACGSVDIPLPETKVSVEASQLDAGRPRVSLQRISQWESASRGMVAEMMILAGDACGQLAARERIPLPFRMQPEPALPAPSELEGLQGVCKGYRLRKCMTRSGVSSVPLRHAGLGLDTYVQVTSPIRRWADIVAHFNLKAHLSNQPLPFSAADIDMVNMAASSDRVRDLSTAERLEESYWICEYFRQRSGTGKGAQTWSATVLGWARQDLRLASVLIDELGYEVIVKIDVSVEPGDYVVLALLEARPVANVLRFYVVDVISSHTPPHSSETDDTHFWAPVVEDDENNTTDDNNNDDVTSHSEAVTVASDCDGVASVSDDSSSVVADLGVVRLVGASEGEPTASLLGELASRPRHHHGAGGGGIGLAPIADCIADEQPAYKLPSAAVTAGLPDQDAFGWICTMGDLYGQVRPRDGGQLGGLSQVAQMRGGYSGRGVRAKSLDVSADAWRPAGGYVSVRVPSGRVSTDVRYRV